MNPRTLSIVVLGATLGLVIALSLFRSHEPRRDATDGVVPSGMPDRAPGDDSVVTDGAEDQVGATLAPERGAGATPGHEERSTPERSPSQSALAAAPPTPMSKTLGELQLPPVPELLETERQFAAAGVDPLWSEGMEGHILGEISQLTGLELVGLQVECKTTLCRLFRSDPCA